jgi:choline-sulfatase
VRAGWALLAAACGAAPPQAREVEATTAPPTGPSVVLITLDTTRADRMSAYGGADAAETPSFDAVAASGALFLRAVSSAPLTIPSHSTMMTGRFPPSHGVRDNGNHVLPASAVTLAERFQAAGYATAAFTSAFPTSRRWGFDQGFDVFSDAMRRDPSVQDWRDERPGGEVVDEAVAWLTATPGPVFLWVHLFDAHWPYAPSEPFRSRYAGRPYEGEIAYADAQVGRLVDALRGRGDTVTAITADHGEGLGEGGEATHGFLLHDATLWVPLALSGPGVPQGLRVEAPVSHVDLAPTLLRLAGLSVHAEVQGRDLLQGGTAEVFSEATTGRTSMGLANLTALTSAAGRVTRGAWTGFYPYDAAAGRVGVAPTQGPEVASALASLAALEARLEVVDAEAPVGDDVGALLEAMGYVTGDPDAAAGDVDPRDVIDLLPVSWEVRRRVAGGDLAGARAGLAQLEQRLAGTAVVEQITIDLLVAEGAHEEAASRALGQAALRDTGEGWRRAGEIAMEAGWLREARDAFGAALEAVPTDARAMVGLVRATVLLDGATPPGRSPTPSCRCSPRSTSCTWWRPRSTSPTTISPRRTTTSTPCWPAPRWTSGRCTWARASRGRAASRSGPSSGCRTRGASCRGRWTCACCSPTTWWRSGG